MTSGDIFKVGQTKVTGPNGKDVYTDVYALSKPLLNKMAMAAGIQFNPKETYGERVDKHTYRAHAQGAIRKADGTARTESDQKEICLLDEEEKYKIEFTDKAEKGIEDWRQANAAAEKDAQKEGAKAAKEQEKNFWKDQKKMGFRDEYNKMKAEDDANAAEAEKLMANGYDPSIYGDLKSKPGFLRRLKEKYLKWRSEAVDAIKCGDKVRLESAYTEIKDIVAIVEAMGLEANAVLG